ncbi:MAG: zinc ribbon domain-containing protein [Armatimonadetes bacterium]|nr:zinc ribbon domain-containing protein [Armatimonadota bacterium]
MRLLLALAVLAVAAGPIRAAAQNGTRPGALSIVESGLAPDGATPRYSIEANGADIRDVLAALLRKTGKEYVINQDVTGPVSFVLRDKTMDDILEVLRAVAKPAIVIERGAVVTVSVAPPSPVQTQALGGAATDSARRSGNRATGNQRAPSAQQQRSQFEALRVNNASVLQNQALAFGQPVNLSIPDDRPVALRAALRQIELQTQVPIRLDPRVSSDIGLAARFTDTPLSLVLDSIGRTGALKWQAQADGSLLISPSDWLLVSVRGLPVWGQPSSVCPQCRRPVLPSWSFCPHDGTPVQKQLRQGAPGKSR